MANSIIASLLGCWQLVAPAGAPASDRYEMVLKPSGELVLAIPEKDRWQLLFFRYHIDENNIVINEPSASEEQRTRFSIANDGLLVLERKGSKRKYKRAATCGHANPPLNRARENQRGGHPEESSLKGIDALFIKTHFLLPGIWMIREEETTEPSVTGCSNSKQFSLDYREKTSKIAILLCGNGIYGPQGLQATVEKILEHFAPTDDASEANKSLAKIISGKKILLKENRVGRTFFMPLIGHGIILIPTAVGVTSDGKMTILIQSDIDIETDTNLLEHMGTLLRAVDSRF